MIGFGLDLKFRFALILIDFSFWIELCLLAWIHDFPANV